MVLTRGCQAAERAAPSSSLEASWLLRAEQRASAPSKRKGGGGGGILRKADWRSRYCSRWIPGLPLSLSIGHTNGTLSKEADSHAEDFSFFLSPAFACGHHRAVSGSLGYVFSYCDKCASFRACGGRAGGLQSTLRKQKDSACVWQENCLMSNCYHGCLLSRMYLTGRLLVSDWQMPL